LDGGLKRREESTRAVGCDAEGAMVGMKEDCEAFLRVTPWRRPVDHGETPPAWVGATPAAVSGTSPRPRCPGRRGPIIADPAGMTHTISRDELRQALAGATPPTILEVLPRPYWRKHHLPGALNLPPDRVESIRELVPDPATDLVLYCWDDA
jgi:hypothetical protein